MRPYWFRRSVPLCTTSWRLIKMGIPFEVYPLLTIHNKLANLVVIPIMSRKRRALPSDRLLEVSSFNGTTQQTPPLVTNIGTGRRDEVVVLSVDHLGT
jgi:hypothetical protein